MEQFLSPESKGKPNTRCFHMLLCYQVTNCFHGVKHAGRSVRHSNCCGSILASEPKIFLKYILTYFLNWHIKLYTCIVYYMLSMYIYIILCKLNNIFKTGLHSLKERRQNSDGAPLLECQRYQAGFQKPGFKD